MRRLLLAALLALPLLSACESLNSPARIGRDTVLETAGRLTQRYSATWNARDMTGFGALYAADARYVNASGTFVRGRSNIVANHRANRGRYAEAARMTTRLRAARAITNDAIVAVMAMEIREPTRPDPVHATRLTLTLVKRDGVWVIAQAQASPPPTPTVPTAVQTQQPAKP